MMIKKTTILLALFFLVSCGESKEKKIEKMTAKILINYSDADDELNREREKYFEKIETELNSPSGVFGISAKEMFNATGVDYSSLIEKDWKKTKDSISINLIGKYKLDSLRTAFTKEFGEDEYNILRLKIEDRKDDR